MSDRPDAPRPAAEAAGGWFVPKNAMTEQQVAALAPQPVTSNVPMPDNPSPQQSGGWYVPAGAIQIPVQGDGGDGQQSAASAAPPIDATTGQPQPPAAPSPDKEAPSAQVLPQGAALSSEVDYSNYVPGKGFVQPAEKAATGTTSAAPADDSVPATGGQAPVETPAPGSQPNVPVTGDQVAAQPAIVGAAGAASIYTPQGAAQTPAPAATGTSQPVSEQPAQAAPAVNPELAQRYTDVEQAVQILRRKYTAGSLTRDQLQAELRKLMILDEEGHWWMIGLESDKWYRFNGKDWIPATPPGRSDSGAAPAVSAAAGSVAVPAATAPSAEDVGFPQNRFDIPLDEYGMPLPQKVPINDPGATMVGMAAPRLDTTLRTEPATRPGGAKFFDRLAAESGVAPYDGGVTVPNAAAQVTQPGAAISLTAPNVAGAVAVPVPGSPAYTPADQAPSVPGKLKPGFQPDYGEKPKGLLEDRQRRAGCLIRLAIVSVFGALFLAILAVVGMVLGYYSIINQYDDNISKLAGNVQSASESARILDVNGRLLYQLNDPNSGARRRVPLNQISPYMIAATVRVENKRFYEDPGFDVIGMMRAVLQNLQAGGTVSGASSITQQMTRQWVLDPGAAQDRSARRKITEVIVSSEIARRYTKSQIMEFYLNTVYYGNLAYGVEAAAQTYFNKSAKDLNIAEAAFLAGLVQAPATYDPILHREAAMARFNDVLGLMADLGCIQMEHPPYDKGKFCVTKSDLDAAIVLIAQVKAKTFKPPANAAIYPHFVNYVQQQLEAKFGKDAIYSSGFNVYTTIDQKIQDIAEQAVKSQIAALRGRNVTNGAVLAIRPQDGAILAMVGSADFNNKDIDGQFNVTLAPRQPGSSIKPFVYIAALERDGNNNYWTPATIIWDVPSCFGTQPGYCPRNYDSQFHGPQSMRSALANSYNIPAVKTLQYVGIDRFKGVAQRVGLTFPLTQPEQAGLAMALGGVEVPLIDMVRGYSVIATGGKRIDSYAIAKVTRNDGEKEVPVFEATDHPSQQVIEPAITYLITSILSDNQARLPAFGPNNPLMLAGGRPAAVKTGTTNDSKDNWTIGFTPQLVVGVWVGNSNNTPMVGTSGVTGAAPIWKQVMDGALAGQPAVAFQPPPNVQQITVCADFGTQDFAECPNRRAEVFFQPNPPPPADNLFQTRQIDSFSGLIANEFCPDYVQNKTFITLNDQTAIAWLNNDPKGQAWAKAHNLDLPIVPPPTQACDANTPRPVLKVTNPVPQTSVQGLLEVRGSVFVPGFNRYQLEVGSGLNATQFQIVDGPITAQPSGDNSFLGRWDTTSVPNGPYTLRLFAVDGQGHHAEILVPLIVNNLAATEVPTQPPVIIPTTVPGQPEQPGQPGAEATATPIIINPNPPTPTLRSMFPPTATRQP
jgi:penicillin-binding protein 1C